MQNQIELVSDLLAMVFVAAVGTWLAFRLKKIRVAFSVAPTVIRLITCAIAIYPIATSTYSFRLYSHPRNPDAWFILALFEAAYLLPASMIALGSNLARWFCIIWVSINVVLGLFRIQPFFSYPDLLAFVIVSWTVQVAVVLLLFTPSARAYFKKEPNQALLPSRL